MIELSYEQVQALMRFMGSAKWFLSTVETASAPTAAVRDSIIGDAEQWRGILLQKLDSPASRGGDRG